jgi:hypothetical protein
LARTSLRQLEAEGELDISTLEQTELPALSRLELGLMPKSMLS